MVSLCQKIRKSRGRMEMRKPRISRLDVGDERQRILRMGGYHREEKARVCWRRWEGGDGRQNKPGGGAGELVHVLARARSSIEDRSEISVGWISPHANAPATLDLPVQPTTVLPISMQASNLACH
jgi:hypothetical protein